VTGRRAIVLARKAASSLVDCRERRPRELERLALALAGHDPQRTLERGYVLATAPDGEPISSAARALPGEELRLRFADGSRDAMILDR
jgi:exodeoxyribonuclease VII large subunit